MKKLLSNLLDKVKPTSMAMISFPAKAIHERKEFLDLIEHERDRVHRDEQQFSLILISVNRSVDKNSAITELVKKASKRVRRIDRIGWFDNTRLGVLLPNTTLSGAQTIAKDICKSQNNSNSTISIETLSYPDKRNT
jgi:PleD family two-component response regulator